MAVVFVVLLGSISSLESANRARAQTAQIMAASSAAEQSVLNMETGLRGFLLTRERRFLEPWYLGRAEFGPAVARLRRLTEHDGYRGVNALASRVARVGASYISDYGEPLVRPLASRIAASALARVTADGKRRVDFLRGLFAHVNAISSAGAESASNAAGAAGTAARTRAVLGLGVALMLITWIVLYVATRVSRPIGRIANAADALAAGDLGVRARERGPGEVIRLATAFNRMAQTISEGSRRLGARNAQLADARATAEQTARELAAKQDLALDIVSSVNLDGYFTSMNAAGRRILGFSEADLLSRPYLDFIHPDDRESTSAVAARITESGQDLINFENRYIAKDGSVRWLEWNVHPALEDGLLHTVARDVTARKEAEEALHAAREETDRANQAKSKLLSRQKDTLEVQVRERTWELEHARMEAFDKLALAAEFRDDDTRLHTLRVGRIAVALASAVGLEAPVVEAIGLVAPLHDLGKIGVPDAILLKPGKLTEDEFAAMKKHAAIGAEILGDSRSPLFQIAGDIAGSHHERWDGTGYPAGLVGEAIPLTARIVALADAFDAMSHDRPYRAAIPLPDVLAEVARCSGTHFDPALVRAFGALDHARLLSSLSDPEGGSTRQASDELGRLGRIGVATSMASVDAALHAVLANTKAAALIADDERRYVAANEAACELLGLTSDELRQKRIDDLVAPQVGQNIGEAWADFMRRGATCSERTLLLARDREVCVASRGLANLIPGRHLAILEPLPPQPSEVVGGGRGGEKK